MAKPPTASSPPPELPTPKDTTRNPPFSSPPPTDLPRVPNSDPITSMSSNTHVPRSSSRSTRNTRSARSTRRNARKDVMSTPTPKSRAEAIEEKEEVGEQDVMEEMEEAEEKEEERKQQEEEEEEEEEKEQVEEEAEEKDVEDDDGEDTVMSLPSPPPQPKTPYRNVDTRVNDKSIFSSGAALHNQSDENDDHEMSDDIAPAINDGEGDDVDEAEQEQEEQKEAEDDEQMRDDEDEDDNDFTEEFVTDYRRGSTGGKVRNHRESGGKISTARATRASLGSSVRSEDEQEDEDEEEQEEEEDDEEGDEEDDFEAEMDRTVKVSLHTPTRPTRAVPRRLLASSVANSSPGRTPLARRILGAVAATPNGIPELDFNTPAIAASAFTGLRTPFLHRGTPASAARPGAVSHFQLAMENEILAEQMKAMEAENKYLRGIAQGAGVAGITEEEVDVEVGEDGLPFDPQPYTEMVDEAALAVMDEFVEYGSPDKKRVKREGPSPAVSRIGEGPETVRKRRQEETDRALQMMNTPTAIKARRESLAKIRSSPVKAFAGLFGDISTPPSIAKTSSESLFGTPGKHTISQPVFEVKSAAQRKEDKRRRMTREFREFSAINLDLLKGWLPTTAEADEEDGGELETKGKDTEGEAQEKAKPEAVNDDTAAVVEGVKDSDGDSGMAEAEKAETEQGEKEAPAAPSAADVPASSPQEAAQATTATPPAAASEGFTLPVEIPVRKVKILPYVEEISRTRRSNSAPPVPNAPSTAAATGDEEEDADISISPLAQEMITSLQQQIAVLQRELYTSNVALSKATAQLVGEMRARKIAEEVREFMEREKSFGVCCQAAINHAKEQKQALEAERAAKAVENKPASKYANASIPTTAHVTGVHPVAATAGKKRARDEREQSAPLPPPATRAIQKSMMAEKRIFSATAASQQHQQPTRPTRTRPAGASTLAGMTAPGASKKMAKTALGNSTSSSNAPHHPPIQTGMEKPAVRGAPTRPRSRLTERDDEPVGRRTRAGSIQTDGSRPLSRFGDRPVRQAAAKDESGLDVFGRLAGGGRSRR